MAITKQSFYQRPKIRSLPAAEKERRWKQHLMSEGGLRDMGGRAGKQRVRGRGNYFTDAMSYLDDKILKKIPRGGFRSAGQALAGDLGGSAGDYLSQLTGRGNYQIKANSIMEGDFKPNALSFSPTGAAGVRIRKREFLKSVIAPADPEPFSMEQFRLQVTDAKSLPWLSRIAEHFTEWQLVGGVFSFETTSSNYSSSMALGTIAIATQYNANEIPFANMEQMLQSAFHTRGNPSETLLHGIECDPELQVSEKLYTRRLGTSGPPNLYDHGVVTVASEGLPTAAANQIIGRIYFTYDVELNLPVLPVFNPNVGKCVALWNANVAIADPPLGSTTTLSDYPMSSLTAGHDLSDNFIFMLSSPGPQPAPDVGPQLTPTLLGWMSDSTNVALTSYITFAQKGMYVLEVTVLGLAYAGQAYLSALALDKATCTVTTWPANLANTNSQYRILVDCTVPNSIIKVTKDAIQVVVAVSTIIEVIGMSS